MTPHAEVVAACLKVVRHLDRLAEQGRKPKPEDVTACLDLADLLDRLADRLPTAAPRTVDTDQQLAILPSGTPSTTDHLTYWHTADRRHPKVHTLVRHGPDGRPAGALTYFPHNGTVTVCVAREHRRAGIGSALWSEALSRWDVQPGNMTPDGAAAWAAYTSRLLRARVAE